MDKRKTFLDTRDYERFLLSMNLLNDEQEGLMIAWRDFKKSNPQVKLPEFLKFRNRKPLVEIIAYCLNPNHYHLILHQIKDKGIENFMHRVGTSHTKYFNKKNDRSGSLFQGVFKSIHIDSNEYLLYLSAYVNKNNFIHGYSKDDSWIYSSFPDYIGKRGDKLCKKDIVLGQFKNRNEYQEFVNENALYMKNKKDLANYLLE